MALPEIAWVSKEFPYDQPFPLTGLPAAGELRPGDPLLAPKLLSPNGPTPDPGAGGHEPLPLQSEAPLTALASHPCLFRPHLGLLCPRKDAPAGEGDGRVPGIRDRQCLVHRGNARLGSGFSLYGQERGACPGSHLLSPALRHEFRTIRCSSSGAPFVSTAVAVVEAQKVRGLNLHAGCLRERARKYVSLLGPIFLVPPRNPNLLAMVLESRGFGARKDRTFLMEIRLQTKDVMVLVLLGLVLLLVLLLRAHGKGQIQGLEVQKKQESP